MGRQTSPPAGKASGAGGRKGSLRVAVNDGRPAVIFKFRRIERARRAGQIEPVEDAPDVVHGMTRDVDGARL